jgi:hypothetical protein
MPKWRCFPDGLWNGEGHRPTDSEVLLLSKGRHSAGRAAGHRRTTARLPNPPPGARKAPPEARKASPLRVGGVEVPGRHVADGSGRPVVLTALGTGEKLFAVLPLAILSVGSVAGLAAMTNGDAATSPSPADPGTAAGEVVHETASRRMLARATPSPAPAAISATPSQVATGAAPGPDTIDEASTDGSAGGSADASADASADPLPEITVATHSPAAEEPATPVPTSSATASPDPTGSDPLTEAEATALCVASGISAADVLALGTCVQDLLG